MPPSLPLFSLHPPVINNGVVANVAEATVLQTLLCCHILEFKVSIGNLVAVQLEVRFQLYAVPVFLPVQSY